MPDKYRTTRFACYTTNISMSVCASLSPILFLTFRDMYGISFTLLGLLVLVNFCTQLGIDLVFSFFSHKFNIRKTVRVMPALTVVGLLVYALWPTFFPSTAFAGIFIGSVIFAASAGLAEVLISPVIAALPSDNPERAMSKLHSVYAWGVVAIVVLSTLYLFAFGSRNWMYLALVWAVVPLVACVLFLRADIPMLATPERASGTFGLFRNRGLILCVLAIFLGGASENTMSQWCSSYVENALGISKVYGDIFGMAMFALMLGLGRTLYARFGKHISRVLLCGFIGTVGCYLIAALSGNGIAGLIACALTGFTTSMLWPGSLIVSSEKYPAGGVVVYALMAAGGDLGSSVAPQLVGAISDAAAGSPGVASLAAELSLTPAALGMRIGLLTGALFPIAGIVVMAALIRLGRKSRPGSDGQEESGTAPAGQDEEADGGAEDGAAADPAALPLDPSVPPAPERPEPDGQRLSAS